MHNIFFLQFLGFKEFCRVYKEIIAKSKLGLINIIELKQLIEDDEIIINREKDQVA